ncbi:hypothetical protein [Massilia sp. TWR1-2-2]|uniref:hypothetical protein n=1 Tax=Massilia sp. TWR1-2-2 TaxID=2804584 RepID=UPI003CEF9E20
MFDLYGAPFSKTVEIGRELSNSGDLDKGNKERDPTLRAILYIRSGHGALSAFYGSAAALSYAGPFLNHQAAKEGRSIVLSKLATKAGAIAEALSERVLLLRTIAWLGWIGVGITVADLAYAGYRQCIDRTAILHWLDHCTFRKKKANLPFRTSREELTELQKVIKLT